jgi:hypothetical protein
MRTQLEAMLFSGSRTARDENRCQPKREPHDEHFTPESKWPCHEQTVKVVKVPDAKEYFHAPIIYIIGSKKGGSTFEGAFA